MEMNRELAETFISRAIDGELPERQRADLESWLAAHPEDRDIAEQWQALGRLARNEAAAIKVPDEEVAWMDIRRAIRNAEPVKEESAIPFFRWRLAWAAAMVAAVCASALVFGVWHGRRTAEFAAANKPAQIEWAETEVAGASTMVYQDDDSGLAVVWLMTDENGNGDAKKKNSG